MVAAGHTVADRADAFAPRQYAYAAAATARSSGAVARSA